MCKFPVSIVREKYKNVYGDRTIPVPCGKCVKCLKKRSNQWTFRLLQEELVSSSSAFITLTYANPPFSQNGLWTLEKKDLQDFWKRLRKKTNNTIKYYACGEYGGISARPHYHAIVFNLPRNWTNINRSTDVIRDTWKLGHTHITTNNVKTCQYVSGYINKGHFEPTNDYDDRVPEYSAMSKGLGKNFLTPKIKRYFKDRLVNVITLEGGKLLSMPRYYSDKIFNEQEKAKMHYDYLQLQKTDIKEFIMNDPDVYNEFQNKIREEKLFRSKYKLLRSKI